MSTDSSIYFNLSFYFYVCTATLTTLYVGTDCYIDVNIGYLNMEMSSLADAYEWRKRDMAYGRGAIVWLCGVLIGYDDGRYV